MLRKIKHLLNRRQYRRSSPIQPGVSGFFSSDGQDRYIAETVFKNRRNGIFVDIGANDGVTLSNTCYLERELGWQGIAIEPLPETYAKLRGQRQCFTLNACITDYDGEAGFLDISGRAEMLSGLIDKYDPRHVRRIHKSLKRLGGEKKEIRVKCLTLASALHQYGFENIDYLSVDTEGGELDIIRSIDFNAIPVTAISVENNYFDYTFRDCLGGFGFELVAVLGVDEVYVNRQHKIDQAA
ncbi:MAG: FkbM family methyltransferase [Gammaproteobacteria bacterium]